MDEGRVTGRGEGNNGAPQGLDELRAPSTPQDAVLEDGVCCAETDKNRGSQWRGFLFTGLETKVFRLGRHNRRVRIYVIDSVLSADEVDS